MSDHASPEAIMQLGMGFWASKTLLSAIELELLTELAKHPEDLSAVQAQPLSSTRRSSTMKGDRTPSAC